MSDLVLGVFVDVLIRADSYCRRLVIFWPIQLGEIVAVISRCYLKSINVCIQYSNYIWQIYKHAQICWILLLIACLLCAYLSAAGMVSALV